MVEIWKDIKRFEGLYQVSNYGRVKSLNRYVYRQGKTNGMTIREKIIKPFKTKFGYLQIALSIGGEKVKSFVHRLVALMFIPNPNQKPNVNHKDGNPLNNNVDNLEWCTQSENALHSQHVLGNRHGKRKDGSTNTHLERAINVYSINGELLNSFESVKMAANHFNILSTAITNNLTGRSKKCNKLIFKYKII